MKELEADTLSVSGLAFPICMIKRLVLVHLKYSFPQRMSSKKVALRINSMLKSVLK